MIGTQTRRTGSFYDAYWPLNVPDHRRTAEHVAEIVPAGRYKHALDGGCGTGVCSLALSQMSEEVVGLDISSGSLNTARQLALSVGATNVEFKQGSLLNLPFPDASFDLTFSWGVIHHTVNPVRALDELVRVLEPGGTLVLAVYLKTALTPLHETIRKVCLKTPLSWRRRILSAFVGFVEMAEHFGHKPRSRNDNPTIASLIEDWYFVPEKHFFTINEMRSLFKERGLTFQVVEGHTGRFRSTSNFIVRGVKHTS